MAGVWICEEDEEDGVRREEFIMMMMASSSASTLFLFLWRRLKMLRFGLIIIKKNCL